MLWVLKRTVSMRRFFWAPKTYAQNNGQENIYNLMLMFFVYLNLLGTAAVQSVHIDLRLSCLSTT